LVRFKNPQGPKGLVGKGTEISDLHLPIKINGDMALFQALGSLLVQWDALDHSFINKYTTGFEQWKAHISAVDWDVVTETTGLSRAQITELGQLLRDSDATVFCWAMGLTQHRNGVATIKEVCNLAFAQGNIGKHGAGLFPVRGHSNVQGDRTMGIWERPPAHFLDALQKEFGFNPPRPHGLDTVDSIRAMRDGKAHFFLGLGGNFVQAASDTDVIVEAMHKTRMTVHISTKLNRSHLVCGDTALILPTKGRTEKDIQASGPQWISVEDSTCSVHSSRGPLEPASPQLMSEVEIICRLAEATIGDRYGIAWKEMRQDYGVIRTHISKVVPGCESYEVNVHRPGGFVMPHPPRDSRTFETKSGKAEFAVSPLDVLQVPEGHLVLQTLRSHDQFNTTIYGLSDRYRGIEGGRKVIFLHADDIKQLGFSNGDFVDILTHWTEDDRERIVRDFRIVEYDTPRGSAAAYYPETNPLIPLDSTALSSNTPTSKSIIVKLLAVGASEPAGPAAPGGEASDQKPVGQEGQDATGADWTHKSDPQPHHLS
jgi:formate dehydrogenase major subunit